MKRPFLIGLTGSIGMGKSTTAEMFAAEGVPVWSGDEAVHRLYSKGGPAAGPMALAFPSAVKDGAVDRMALKQIIAEDVGALKRIESIVHPLVAADREAFITDTDAPIVLLDIPLLFETGGDKRVDAVIVVSAPEDIQRDRVLARPGMTEPHFETILAKQTPDEEKRKRADYVIETVSLEAARAQVQSCLKDIRKRMRDA